MVECVRVRDRKGCALVGTNLPINNCTSENSKGCPNGRMDKKQFRSMYETVFKTGDAFQFVECVFHAYDRDGDGNIDFGLVIVGRLKTELVIGWAELAMQLVVRLLVGLMIYWYWG